MDANDSKAFDHQARLEGRAETDIIEMLDQLLSLAQHANLTDTIAYLAVCHTLVVERRKKRVAERH